MATPKAADPATDVYASHLPVLHALAGMVPFRRILEFGQGHYSTGYFVSSPGIEVVHSVETNDAWRRKLGPNHWVSKQRRRWQPRDHDAVFIDDGADGDTSERVGTIEWVLTRSHPLVVIHDAEVPDYFDAIADHVAIGDYTMVAPITMPATAVIWDGPNRGHELIDRL